MAEEVVDFEVARRKMKKWRDEGYRNSDEIVDLGECLIYEYANKLGDELWVLYEQVCIAAYDCSRIDLAVNCLRALDKQFPSGNRVLRLRAMRKEALKQFADAEKIYKIMLEDDPANLHVRKRLITIQKSQNRIEAAIQSLNEYLKEFMGDQEAWMELCELYIHQQEYAKAAFCMEELILSHPHNHLYHQRYAEIHYTMGMPDSLEKAKKYFAQALKLDPNNVRALYGLYLAATNSVTSKTASSMKKKNINMSQWTVQQVMDLFDMNVSENQKQTLTDMFDNMQLSLPSTVPE
ncbi:ER membrane protein complex subunit 2-like [Hydractinia symbiolongicarpus]|uniref:ER membrane protein complex subunit 2-like n=1 Tax=Hydractinia symbiolongicarpus TaxID=13093 RepID=UPI00254E73CC|nr:ER membrane protein complex subunit 2-like [Hydractinia symbiolongicarpus]